MSKQKLSESIARLICLAPVLILVVCLLVPLVSAVAGRDSMTTSGEPLAGSATREPSLILYESDKPVLHELDEPVEEKHYPSSRNLGEFTLTAYCPCEKCCGKTPDDPYYKVTASGTICEANRTVAVDTDVIPMGSILYINGYKYIAEDVGGAILGNHIDIYFDTHQEALEFGVQTADVYIFE